jgi:hypothetical protein
MPRLVPNPVADVIAPLQRMERALATVAEHVTGISSLNEVERQLSDANAKLDAILATLREIQAGLVAPRRPAPQPARGRRADAAPRSARGR